MKNTIQASPLKIAIACIIAFFTLTFFPTAAVWIIPLFTLVLVLVTRQPALGLLMGTFFGAYILHGQGLGPAIVKTLQTYIFGALNGPWHVSALLFTLILGAFAGVLQAGGGFEGLASKLIGQGKQSQRRVEMAAGGLGLICFFDGLANSMLVGQLSRPLYDRLKIPRARLAYIVDSTSSAVACISFISTWIAMQLSLIQAAIDTAKLDATAYDLFFRSIPQNYYCWFTLVMVGIVIWQGWNIGPMSREIPTPTLEHTPSESAEHTSIWRGVGPLIILIGAIVASFYLWGTETVWPITGEKITASFGGKAGPYALTLGSAIGLLTAYLWVPKQLKTAAAGGAKKGAADMLPPLIILIAAWSFGSMLKDLGTAVWLSDNIVHLVPPEAFPLAIFVVGALISLSTGSSWGTMGLLMPIALGTWLALNPGDVDGMITVIAAVFSGAVFGDHCSPFSDTTIVSSFASGVTTDVHVKTQTPYALITAAVTAVFGFGAAAIGTPPILSLLIGSGALFITVRFLAKDRS